MGETIDLKRGVFTISLDFELIWGTLDLLGVEGFGEQCRIEREVVIDRLLDLFEEFDVSATWCILGHLFLESCEAQDGVKHPELVRPNHSWHPGDWFERDPCGNIGTDPYFYGADLVRKIRDCKVYQEIGSHSFSHVIYGDNGCSAEAARTDLAACLESAAKLEVNMRSFVFPRNEIGHLDLVKDAGFDIYRGAEPNWFENSSVPQPLRRAMRLLDVLRAAEPPVVVPEKDPSGLWNIPGSAMFFPMNGIRRYLPMSRRIKRARKGLNAAVSKRKIFHLWFHPTNMSDETETMFAGLRDILEAADKLRGEGRLDILPLAKIIG